MSTDTANGNDYDNIDAELNIFQNIILLLKPFDISTRLKILNMVNIFFRNTESSTQHQSINIPAESLTSDVDKPRYFSKDRSLTPKEFLREKRPETDVEKVACLAYYLTYYNNTPHFKTIDISKLNTEAAQRKFSNATKAVTNATQYGYLATIGKGKKQLSADGEMYVLALPDKDEARKAMRRIRPRKKKTVDD